MKKSKYDELDISESLSNIVYDAIEVGFKREKRKLKMYKTMKISIISFLLLFLIPLNTIPVYAKTLNKIPIIKDIAKIFTFREYHFEDDIKYIDAKIPQFSYEGKTELEKRVNQEVSKLIYEELELAKNNVKEYYKAFIETGGKKEDFIPIGINIDYEIKCISENIVSFVITKSETFSSAYYDEFYYNIDLETGKYFTLKDLLGNDYKKIVTENINIIITNWSKEQKEALFNDINIEDLINENTNFYINDLNEIVVVFQKYEIAVGAAGRLEFPITKIK